MFDTVILICMHWASLAHSEKLLDKIGLGKCKAPYIKSQYCFLHYNHPIYKTGECWGKDIFAKGHSFNKLSPLDDAAYHILMLLEL